MPSTKTATRTSGSRSSHGNRGKRPSSRARGAAPASLVDAQVDELVLQALETELGGVQVYETAVRCAVNPDLKREWSKYLDQTRNHVTIVESLCQARGLDPEQDSPGRQIVRSLGEALVQAMETAEGGDAEAAELVACECVTLAETKDHQNWQLLKEVAKELEGDEREEFEDACGEVEGEEDEHLYHTMGWARESWLRSLGLPAVLPPPEERAHVRSMVGAAAAKKGRKALAKRG